MSNSEVISDGYWLRTHAKKNGIPADCGRAYQFLFNQGVEHFKNIIDDIIGANGGKVSLPMQTEYLERYLSGYSFEYRPFSKLIERDEDTEGFWQIDREDPTRVLIFYNRCPFTGRQRHTQVHELLHFLQTVDLPFLDFLDELIINSALPEYVVVKLLHRITDRATVMYLMPNDYFLRKYQEIHSQAPAFGEFQLRQLAETFDVSMQSAKYRIEECLREQPALHNLGFMVT